MFRIFLSVRCARFYCAVATLLWASSASADGLTFDQALQLAVRQSPDIQAQVARVEAARQAQGPADALPDPTLILGLDNVPVEGPDRYSLSSDFMTMQRVGISQRFPNRSKLKARALESQQRTGLAQSMADATRLHVIRETAQAWIEADALHRQLALVDALLEENRLFEQAVRARLSSGQGNATESIEPRQEAAALQDQRDRLLARQRQAQAELIRWLGADGNQPVVGAAPIFEVDPEHLLHSLHQHPELDVARRQIEVASAIADQARAEKKPDWTLTLAYMDREDFSDMAMLQINVDLPLFSGSRQGPRIASAEADRLALAARAQGVQREHEAMLQSELAEFERVQRSLARQQQTLIPLADEKVKLASAAWRSGESSLTELVRARRQRLEAGLTEIELVAQRDQIAAALHFSYDHDSALIGKHDDEY
ncbi:MAG: TolC family protein [Alcanivoracaceae bacterium]|nr:TolC family protein [Alcanivoracaceae bacterium]